MSESIIVDKQSFKSWAIVELLGHVRTAGLVTEEERFGAKLGRCDVPRQDGTFTTFFFGGSSVYRMTPCSEEAARAVAKGNEPRPVHQWELPKPAEPVEDADELHRINRLDHADPEDVRDADLFDDEDEDEPEF